jgi:hypothetical protein
MQKASCQFSGSSGSPPEVRGEQSPGVRETPKQEGPSLTRDILVLIAITPTTQEVISYIAPGVIAMNAARDSTSMYKAFRKKKKF